MASLPGYKAVFVAHASQPGTELLIIVAGVLIALGAQGAAQEWSDRQHEHDRLLLQVVDDEQNALPEPLRGIIAMREEEVGT